MSVMLIAFHSPDCDGSGETGCYGYVATIPDGTPQEFAPAIGVAEAFNAGIDSDTPWHIHATPLLPDAWIDDSYKGRMMTAAEMLAIPEPPELRTRQNAQWN